MIKCIYSQFAASIELIRQRKTVLITRGIMMSDDVVLIELMNEICTLKKEYVLKRHVNKDGTPKSIHQKDLGDGLVWVTYLKRKRITGETEKVVYDKLFKIYAKDDPNINLDDFNYLDDNYYSFKEMFDLGMIEWRRENNAPPKGEDFIPEQISARNTADRKEQAYRTFISDDFGKTDVRIIISEGFLYNYTIDMLEEYQKTKGCRVKMKAFSEHYKGVLNLALNYAKRKKYIKTNPLDDKCFLSSRSFVKWLDCRKKKTEEEIIPEEKMEKMISEVRKRIADHRAKGKCYTNGYMFLLEKTSGLRGAELCGLRKEDVKFKEYRLHVYSQELFDHTSRTNGVVSYTKDENDKHIIMDGRYVPILPEAEDIILEYYENLKEAGIESEWLFSREDGTPIKNSQYDLFFRRLCKKYDAKATNNHALRKAYNSYYLVPAGIPSTDRAKIMGHSPQTNERNYTFERLDYCDIAREKILKSRKNH